MSESSKTDKIREELQKCKDSPIYFISKYIKVTHPVRGLVPFKLYPFQEKILSDIQNHRFNILRKFRQAGCTTIGAAYCLWFALFNDHKTIVILSKGDTEATEVLERIKLMYEELPKPLQRGIVEDNKHTLKLKNQSVIKSRPSGKQSGRSLAGSFLVIDEAAFIENIDTLWAAVYPTISTGGRAFVLSTVNGIGNWYHDVYTKAINGANSFNAIDITWKEHPEYHYNPDFEFLYEEMAERGLDIHKWEETTRSNMPLKQWKQEYECDFLGTGDTYVDGAVLEGIKNQVSDDYRIKYNNRMRVWKDPEPEYSYILAGDVALGRDRDYSAFHIINAYNGQQVAEFYSNKTPINEFAKIIATEATLYNIAHVITERNTIGNNLIDWLHNIYEYENLWMDERGDIGFQTTAKNKEELLATLEEALRTEAIKINSARTIDELFTFVIKENGRVEAEKGHNDDLVMSLALGVKCYNDLVDSGVVDYVSKIPHKEPVAPTRGYTHNIQTAGGSISKEDYKWLIK